MNKLKTQLFAAVREAGEAVLSLQQNGFSIAKKANNDIVTEADERVNDILKARLLKANPQAAWLSEESQDDSKRLQCEEVFIVDPIDGTREFASGILEYAISVALVEKGKPILAVVFNPATNELFYAEKGAGAFLWNKKIHCLKERPSNHSLCLLASRSEYERGEWQRFSRDHEVRVVGSIAYKLALIADGRAHATFSLGPKNEWDVAAGVLLVQEAGGNVTDKCGHALLFNQPHLKVNGIIAATSLAYSEVRALIAE